MEARARVRQMELESVAIEQASLPDTSKNRAPSVPPRSRCRSCWGGFVSVCLLLRRIIMLLPVLLVVALTCMYWYTFVVVFQIPRYQVSPVAGVIWILLFSVAAVLCLTSYFRCVITSNSVTVHPPPSTFAVEDCRRCDRCNALKPNRTHHCSMCGECVLKMDHHCPWVANCVGHYNHKYFFLFVLYAALGCVIYVAGSFEFLSVKLLKTPGDGTGALVAFMTLFSVISAFAFSITLVGFSGLHLHLILTNQTTLEFGYLGTNNPYNLGRWRNFELVFGTRKRYWLLPVNTLQVTGYAFHSYGSDTHLRDCEAESATSDS